MWGLVVKLLVDREIFYPIQLSITVDYIIFYLLFPCTVRMLIRTLCLRTICAAFYNSYV